VEKQGKYMGSRHEIDTSLRFDRNAKLSDNKKIEVPDTDPVPRSAPPTVLVAREIYRASTSLEEAVNLAIALGRPLLLQGDPGSGKTRLAHAIAFAFGFPLEECYIKSTTKAQDLLYSYDAVTRLYDAQLAGRGLAVDAKTAKFKGKAAANAESVTPDIRRYIRFGPLGRAIIRASYGRRSVVLIDEIDKADIDFPNDLLRELDRLEFEVAESPDLRFGVAAGRPDLRPIIVITHNEEKALPTAFLRRCVFHFVEFPRDPLDLDAILGAHAIRDPKLRDLAVNVVNRLRSRSLLKKPGLSELLDWAGYLQATGVKPDDIDGLPAAEALLKSVQDLKQGEEEFSSTASAEEAP
jgi:MoxR-like ATPase